MASLRVTPFFCLVALPLAGEGYLSPTIVETILDGKYPAHLTMKDLMEPFPMEWGRQREHFFSRGRNGKDG